MYLGLDIGGTKIFGVAVDQDPTEPAATAHRATTADGDQLLSDLVEMVAELGASAGSPAETVGVGIAGFVDRDGTLRYSPNIPGVIDYPLRRRLEDELAVAVEVENDATAAAYAEARFGAGRGSDHVALVTLGTGIGTGFVLDGILHRGWNGFSGESGHMIIEMTGEEYVTGARGPWELYASGPGLGVLVRNAVVEGRLEIVAEQVHSVNEITGEHLEPAIRAGDPDALEVLDEYTRLVAIGVANLVHILDLEVVVIGGGLVDLGAPLIDGIRKWTNEMVLRPDVRPRPRVVAAQLGSAAGALGAAHIARDRG